MANRLQASTHRKVPQVKHNIHLQQSRAHHLVALVPKSGAKSDVDDSDSSDEETQYQHYHQRNSDISSPPPSLPSSLENLNLLSSVTFYHRWYLPIFSQLLDICVNNAWLLYRRDMRREKSKKLKEFRLEIIGSLLKFERDEDVTRVSSTKTIPKPVASRPPDVIRYYQMAHYPTLTSGRGRCMRCTKGQTKIFCHKCKLRLCLLPERNCFLEHHTKK